MTNGWILHFGAETRAWGASNNSSISLEWWGGDEQQSTLWIFINGQVLLSCQCLEEAPAWCRHYLQCSVLLRFCRCHIHMCMFPCCSLLPFLWPRCVSFPPLGREHSLTEIFQHRPWTTWHLWLLCSAHRTKPLHPSQLLCSCGVSLWSTGHLLQVQTRMETCLKNDEELKPENTIQGMLSLHMIWKYSFYQRYLTHQVLFTKLPVSP